MKFLGKRAMLNRPGYHSTAAIVAEVEDTSKWKPDKHSAPYTTFQVSDCYRAVTFDLDWNDAADRRNSLHKIDTMIAVLTAFREGVEAEQQRYVERERAKKGKKVEKESTHHSWPV